MKYKIYSLNDISRLDEICKLFATGLAETTKEEWIWKYYTENGLPEGELFVAENEEGKLCGMFGMQPAVYKKDKKEIILVQAGDLVIAPEHRGQGLMRQLYNYVMDYYEEKGATAIVSFSTNDNSYPVFIKYGAKECAKFYEFQTKKTIIPKVCGKKSYEQNGWKIYITDQMPKNLFFAEKNTVWKLQKNMDFMKWKFQENLDQKYSWLLIEYQDELFGYIVFYVNKGRLRSAVNICDWELNPNASENVLGEAIKILQSFGNWVNLWGIMDKDSLILWEKAGLKIKTESRSHFMYHKIREVNDTGKWLITKADSDN